MSVLDLGRFTASYPGDVMRAIEAACEAVARPPFAVTHESFVGYPSSGACVLTCSSDTQQFFARLRQDLQVALRMRGVKYKSLSAAHMTLFYEREHPPAAAALDAPLNWTADGFSLLCSHRGLGYHEVVRNWRSQP